MPAHIANLLICEIKCTCTYNSSHTCEILTCCSFPSNMQYVSRKGELKYFDLPLCVLCYYICLLSSQESCYMLNVAVCWGCCCVEPFDILSWLFILMICMHMVAFTIMVFEWVSPSGYDLKTSPPQGIPFAHIGLDDGLRASFLCRLYRAPNPEIQCRRIRCARACWSSRGVITKKPSMP